MKYKLNPNIKGEIYIIYNNITEKAYVGQALTYKKNTKNGKEYYYKHGTIGRWKDHVSEALNNRKKKQCSYLNNSIRKYGVDAFEVHKIVKCEVNELDKLEKLYIKDLNTLYPNGYNLNEGGNRAKLEEHTRKKISQASIKQFSTVDARKDQSVRTSSHNDSKRLKRFVDDIIDTNKDISDYVVPYNRNGTQIGYRFKINGKRADFISQYTDLEVQYSRLLKFVNDLIELQSQ